MNLEEFTQWDHEVSLEPRSLAMLFGGLVISLGLTFVLYFTIKNASS